MKPAEIERKPAQHDHDIEAIRKLLKSGIRLVVRIEQAQLQIEQAQLKNDRQISQLLASQQNTGKQVQSLLKAIERGRNGNGKAPR